MYLATPLYLETPLEKPLLFLGEDEIEYVRVWIHTGKNLSRYWIIGNIMVVIMVIKYTSLVMPGILPL
jgi:hypothetical protein